MNTAGNLTYSLNELALLVQLPVRTVRYYVQLGLVDRPDGETRAAKYGLRHLEQLVQIRKWSDAGLSLDRIRELLNGAAPVVPQRAPRPGSIEVRSHLYLGEGVELVVEPTRAGLSPEQLRRFLKDALAALEAATQENPVEPSEARSSKE